VVSLLALGMAALAALVLLAAAGLRARLVALGCAGASAVLAMPAMLALTGDGVAAVALPVGPPWAPGVVALDGLSAWFLVVTMLAAVPACIFAAQSGLGRVQTAALPAFLGGMALTLLAADAFTVLLGFEAMSLASWAMIAAGGERRAARLYLGFALLSGLGLLGAFALLASGGLSFAGIRTAPPEGLRAGLVLLLLIVGAGSKAGLAPFHLWLPVAHPAAPTAASALMSAAMVKVALYLLLRGLLDLAGPAQPAWWGVPLLALGAATALIGGLRANLERDIKAILACSTLENVGLIAIGIGLVLIFRGADLRPLAALALGFVLLHALVHAAFKTLLFLGAGAVALLAGSRDPDRLGGLIQRMPVVAAVVALGAASAAALPPFSGFSSEWLFLQAMVQAWRVADMPLQLLGAATLAVAGLAVALSAAAMVRLFGLVFLGRPRTPRAAGAAEATGLLRLALILPAALTALLAVFGAPALSLAGGAARLLLGPAAALPVNGMGFALGEAGAAYLPWMAALLLLGLAALLLAAARRVSPAAYATAPAWDGGYGPPPPHLPFGEPRTQLAAAGAGQPLGRMLGGVVLRVGEGSATARDRGFGALHLLHRARRAASARAERLRDLRLQQFVAIAFGTLVALLALLAWLERP
jgi:formate hydrogenlyase subunit 3/multisubunit Na+/H+ antiporter MnhD subunit